jgi:hypothetical protein
MNYRATFKYVDKDKKKRIWSHLHCSTSATTNIALVTMQLLRFAHDDGIQNTYEINVKEVKR